MDIGNPYKTSLKPAIWNVAYLLSCLQKEQNIWRFEETSFNLPSYETTVPVFVEYHLVEKGKLRSELLSFLKLKKSKKITLIENKKYIFDYLIRRMKFKIFGYYIFKLKKIFKKNE